MRPDQPDWAGPGAEFPSVLIIGGDSKLGSALYSSLVRRGGGDCRFSTRRALSGRRDAFFLDLNEPPSQWALPAAPGSGRGAAIICAAETRLEICQRQPDLTRHLNVDQTLALAAQLRDRGWSLYFLSTSLVFDGQRAVKGAGCPPSPAAEYGRQKAQAEAGLRELDESATIIRLTKVVSADLPLFLRWKKALAAGETIRAFYDMYLAPVHLSAATWTLAEIIGRPQPGRIHHISSPDAISYLETARILVRTPTLKGEERSIAAVSAQDHLPASFIARYPALPTNIGLPGAERAIHDCL